MKDLYEILATKPEKYETPVTIIAIGRSVLPFYDIFDEYTRDLDF